MAHSAKAGPRGRAPYRPLARTQLCCYFSSMKFPRVTVDPAQMAGVPCIRSLRIPVATVLKLMAEGSSRDEILQLYPDLEPADIDQSLAYAADAVEQREIQLAS